MTHLSKIGYKRVAHWSLVVLVVFWVGFFAGKRGGAASVGDVDIHKIRSANNDFKFIKPLLGIDAEFLRESLEYSDLEGRVRAVIDDAKGKGDAERISFYFRDLERVTAVGIDENEAYDPASLLKVPIMIAYLKKAEANPGILVSNVIYPADPRHKTPASSWIESGKPYSIDALIRYMIVDSDNVAKNLLLDANLIGKNGLKDLFDDLDVAAPADYAKEYFISAKNYAMFFRVLFNATYLNREMSEKALKLLAETAFEEGIIAGIPQGVPLSHKWGEYGTYADGVLVSIELHDCGIVYYPENAYLICVMTKGRDVGALSRVIRDISRTTYEAVREKYPAK